MGAALPIRKVTSISATSINTKVAPARKVARNNNVRGMVAVEDDRPLDYLVTPSYLIRSATEPCT
jgi:hypothetical protein